jgi:hypothetical protein
LNVVGYRNVCVRQYPRQVRDLSPGCRDAAAPHRQNQEITMSGKNISIVVAAVALGIVGAATVARAGDQGEDRGGYVVPGSMVGVNPVYHPYWFGRGSVGPAGNAYGFAPIPIQKHHVVHRRIQER